MSFQQPHEGPVNNEIAWVALELFSIWRASLHNSTEISPGNIPALLHVAADQNRAFQGRGIRELAAACPEDVLRERVVSLTQSHQRTPQNPYDLPELLARGIQVGALIGRGGMGVVYKCRQVNANRDAAIKFIKWQTLSADKSFQHARFEQEAKLLAPLEHGNIGRVYDVGVVADWEQERLPYILMELIEGDSLQNKFTLASDSRQRTFEICQAFLDICKAVEYAHDSGVFHRDIKPANILLHGAVTDNTDFTAKLMDFGLAELVVDTQSLRIMGASGTPGYRSPAALRGKPVNPARVDIFSLGVLLYRMLCGVGPYGEALAQLPRSDDTEEHCENEACAVETCVKNGIRLPKQIASGTIRSDIESIIARAVDEGSIEVYKAVKEIRTDVTRLLKGETVTDPKRNTLSLISSRWMRRHPAIVAGLCLLFALITTSIIAYFATSQRRLTQQIATQILIRDLIKRAHTSDRSDESIDFAAMARQLAIKTATTPLHNKELAEVEWLSLERTFHDSTSLSPGQQIVSADITNDQVVAIATSPGGIRFNYRQDERFVNEADEVPKLIAIGASGEMAYVTSQGMSLVIDGITVGEVTWPGEFTDVLGQAVVSSSQLLVAVRGIGGVTKVFDIQPTSDGILKNQFAKPILSAKADAIGKSSSGKVLIVVNGELLQMSKNDHNEWTTQKITNIAFPDTIRRIGFHEPTKMAAAVDSVGSVFLQYNGGPWMSTPLAYDKEDPYRTEVKEIDINPECGDIALGTFAGGVCVFSPYNGSLQRIQWDESDNKSSVRAVRFISDGLAVVHANGEFVQHRLWSNSPRQEIALTLNPYQVVGVNRAGGGMLIASSRRRNNGYDWSLFPIEANGRSLWSKRLSGIEGRVNTIVEIDATHVICGGERQFQAVAFVLECDDMRKWHVEREIVLDGFSINRIIKGKEKHLYLCMTDRNVTAIRIDSGEQKDCAEPIGSVVFSEESAEGVFCAAQRVNKEKNLYGYISQQIYSVTTDRDRPVATPLGEMFHESVVGLWCQNKRVYAALNDGQLISTSIASGNDVWEKGTLFSEPIAAARRCENGIAVLSCDGDLIFKQDSKSVMDEWSRFRVFSGGLLRARIFPFAEDTFVLCSYRGALRVSYGEAQRSTEVVRRWRTAVADDVWQALSHGLVERPYPALE